MVNLEPTKGSEQGGTRPVIVVSRNSINQNLVGNASGLVIVGVPTTDLSNLSRIYPSHVELKKGMGGLTMDCVALCEQVRSVAVERLVRFMGVLPTKELAQIEEALRVVLMLPRD
jgi:mRNA interferase MazF